MGDIKRHDAEPPGDLPAGEAAAGCLPDVRIEHLLPLFYGPPASFDDLGRFERVTNVPPPYDRLLDHNEHMTVTVEAFHGESVDVVVHRCERRGKWYAREITLVGGESAKVVQYGIVRLNVETLSPEVWQRIERQDVPLGRVLIEHNVLREVQLQGLWEIEAGKALAGHLNVELGTRLYGRTALIYCNGEPTIELLEIVKT